MFSNRLFSHTLSFTTIALLGISSHATVLRSAKDAAEINNLSERFFFWEKCEDQLNEDTGLLENCCKGNYRCSNEVCQSSAICKFGILGNMMWCHSEKCTVLDEQLEPSEEAEPEASTESDANDNDGHDEGGDNGGTEEDKDEDEKDESEPSPSPSSSALPSVSPTPSSTPVPSSTSSASPNPPNEDLYNCNGQRNRREIRDMTPEQRQQWQSAVLSMHADRDADGLNEFDRLVRVHMNFNDEAHGGAYFLPWHRLFLLRLENALRKYQSDLALPYWDWAHDANDAALSPVWNPGYTGGAQRGNRPIQTGPFADLEGRVPDNHVVRRDFTSSVPREIPQLWGSSTLDALTREPSWAEFTDALEAAHALPHIYIGGNMGDAFRAPNDPVFYLHHTFIDWVWAERQKTWPSQFGGTHDFASRTENARSDKILEAFGLPASRAFQMDCVNYIAPKRNGQGARTMQRNPQDGDPCSHLGDHTLSEERCRRGEQTLRKESR